MSFLARGFLRTSIHFATVTGGSRTRRILPHTIHVWYIYLHLAEIYCYNPYKCLHRWVNGVVTLVIAGRGPRVINIDFPWFALLGHGCTQNMGVLCCFFVLGKRIFITSAQGGVHVHPWKRFKSSKIEAQKWETLRQKDESNSKNHNDRWFPSIFYFWPIHPAKMIQFDENSRRQSRGWKTSHRLSGTQCQVPQEISAPNFRRSFFSGKTNGFEKSPWS